MAEATLFVLVQIPFGVDVDSVDNDADMQMISGHIAGSADFGNGVVFVHRIANLSQKLAAMGVKGAIPAAVVDDEIISITDMVAGLYDRTGFHCFRPFCRIAQDQDRLAQRRRFFLDTAGISQYETAVMHQIGKGFVFHRLDEMDTIYAGQFFFYDLAYQRIAVHREDDFRIRDFFNDLA